MLEWKRELPDAVGYWLRCNAGRRISRHLVVEIDGVKNIDWGGDEDKRLVHLTDPNLRGWWWMGPIFMPEGDPYQPEWQDDVRMATKTGTPVIEWTST